MSSSEPTVILHRRHTHHYALKVNKGRGGAGEDRTGGARGQERRRAEERPRARRRSFGQRDGLHTGMQGHSHSKEIVQKKQTTCSPQNYKTTSWMKCTASRSAAGGRGTLRARTLQAAAHRLRRHPPTPQLWPPPRHARAVLSAAHPAHSVTTGSSLSLPESPARCQQPAFTANPGSVPTFSCLGSATPPKHAMSVV